MSAFLYPSSNLASHVLAAPATPAAHLEGSGELKWHELPQLANTKKIKTKQEEGWKMTASVLQHSEGKKIGTIIVCSSPRLRQLCIAKQAGALSSNPLLLFLTPWLLSPRLLGSQQIIRGKLFPGELLMNYSTLIMYAEAIALWRPDYSTDWSSTQIGHFRNQRFGENKQSLIRLTMHCTVLLNHSKKARVITATGFKANI